MLKAHASAKSFLMTNGKPGLRYYSKPAKGKTLTTGTWGKCFAASDLAPDGMIDNTSLEQGLNSIFNK